MMTSELIKNGFYAAFECLIGIKLRDSVIEVDSLLILKSFVFVRNVISGRGTNSVLPETVNHLPSVMTVMVGYVE